MHVFVQVGGSNSTTAGGIVESLERRAAEDAVVAFIAKAQADGDPVHAGQQSHRNIHVRMEAAKCLPKPYASKKKRLFDAVERLRAEGRINVATVRDKWRKPTGVLVPVIDETATGAAT